MTTISPSVQTFIKRHEDHGWQKVTDLTDLNFTAPSGFHADTHLLGFWRNPDNGDWYIDISRRYTDLTIAMTDAADLGELAIWDIANNCAIDIQES